MSILIKNALHRGQRTDVFIRGKRIEKIATGLSVAADDVIDGAGLAILPSFVNGHTHAAMTLMRGYADDMALHRWLTQYIWPLEAKLGEQDVYHGARLAALEMIKSGTTFFNDMYWHWHGTARAVVDMGIRAAIAAVFIDFGDEKKTEEQKRLNLRLFEESRQYGDRVIFTLGPHAIYTVSENALRWCSSFAEEHGLLIHLHVSETEKEVADSLEKFGMRPVNYLNSLGLLSPRLISCHTVWADDREIELLAQNRVRVVHNPVSNMKLAGGSFRYKAMKAAGIPVVLGTDGCSSNNNLDMAEEMKFAAIYAKAVSRDPTIFPAEEAFRSATVHGARAFGLDCGEIREGSLADCILVRLDDPRMVPNYNIISNMVYSAGGSVVDTTICDGKILMRGGRVPGEEEIIARAREVAQKLVRAL